jgi:negative regulator of flagellin synthesis FlgM
MEHTMKIGPLDTKIAAPPLAGERKSASASKADGSSPSAMVDLSSVATMKVDAEGEGSFDAAKVARIAEAIREGRLIINASAIADKLLANAQEVLDQQRR